MSKLSKIQHDFNRGDITKVEYKDVARRLSFKYRLESEHIEAAIKENPEHYKLYQNIARQKVLRNVQKCESRAQDMLNGIMK